MATTAVATVTNDLKTIISLVTTPVVKFPADNGGNIGPIGGFPNAPANPSPPLSDEDRTNAATVAAIVAATPAGALIPQLPSSVPGTGASLLSTPTVKVDAADSGGVSGQVIATIGGGSSSRGSALPGLLSYGDAPAKPERKEPRLADQPSQINDEAFLD